MSHKCRNFSSIIWVSIFIKRYADELMRWDKVVEELLDAVAEGFPVTIVLLNDVGSSVWIALLWSIPKRLAFGVAYVFGSARDTDDIYLATIFFVAVDGSQLSVPWCHTVESFVLDVIQRSGACFDCDLAVEDRKHVVTFLNFSLVGGNTNQSILRKLLILDPLLSRSDVGLSITIGKDFDVDVSRGSISSSCDHN